MTAREITLIKAKLAEQVERYDEMVTAMKELAEKSSEQELNEEEIQSTLCGLQECYWHEEGILSYLEFD